VNLLYPTAYKYTGTLCLKKTPGCLEKMVADNSFTGLKVLVTRGAGFIGRDITNKIVVKLLLFETM
jgi:hypothetical protein